MLPLPVEKDLGFPNPRPFLWKPEGQPSPGMHTAGVLPEKWKCCSAELRAEAFCSLPFHCWCLGFYLFMGHFLWNNELFNTKSPKMVADELIHWWRIFIKKTRENWYKQDTSLGGSERPVSSFAENHKDKLFWKLLMTFLSLFHEQAWHFCSWISTEDQTPCDAAMWALGLGPHTRTAASHVSTGKRKPRVVWMSDVAHGWALAHPCSPWLWIVPQIPESRV